MKDPAEMNALEYRDHLQKLYAARRLERRRLRSAGLNARSVDDHEVPVEPVDANRLKWLRTCDFALWLLTTLIAYTVFYIGADLASHPMRDVAPISIGFIASWYAAGLLVAGLRAGYVLDRVRQDLRRGLPSLISQGKLSVPNDRPRSSADLFLDCWVEPKYLRGRSPLLRWLDRSYIRLHVRFALRPKAARRPTTKDERGITTAPEKSPATVHSDFTKRVSQLGMSPYQFEEACAAELRARGWAARATKKSGDQGVDVIAERNGIKVVLQCKLYNGSVGNAAVQEIIAGCAFEKAHHAAVVTTGQYTASARQLAERCGVKLLTPSSLSLLDEWAAHR